MKTTKLTLREFPGTNTSYTIHDANVRTDNDFVHFWGNLIEGGRMHLTVPRENVVSIVTTEPDERERGTRK